MRVGILGAGRLGGTLARLLGAHGHEVVLANSRGREAVARIAAGWPGVLPATRDELPGCDVVVLAIPWRAAAAALDGLDLAGHVVVDATNGFDEDYDVVEPGHPLGSSGVIADLLPGARIVKAFNTLPEERLVEDRRDGAATERRVGLPVAADDVAAIDEVADLIADLGFTAVQVGGLQVGRELMEPTSPLFNVPLPAAELEARVRRLQAGRHDES